MASLLSFEQALAQDLIDALWLESLYDFPDHCRFVDGPGQASDLVIALGDAEALRWRGTRADGLRPFRVSHALPEWSTAKGETAVTLREAVGRLQDASWWTDDQGRFKHFFDLAYQQAESIASREPAIVERLWKTPQAMLGWEILSCLKDRPFHPLAFAKDWSRKTIDGKVNDFSPFMPIAMQSFELRWIAVPRDRMQGNADSGQGPAETLLSRLQFATLRQIAEKKHLQNEDWLWLPVHPWQWRWLHSEKSSFFDECVDMEVTCGSATSTASLRSLIVEGVGDAHVKLGLSVNTLGAVRTLPPRYLHNAVLASVCLQSLRQRDEWLSAHMQLCDENSWWAYTSEPPDVASLISSQGELACLLRKYPELPGTVLIPMAAFPVRVQDGSLPAFDYLLGDNANQEEAWTLFRDIVQLLVELGLRCLSYGVMPELHGQNLVLICRGREMQGLLLRDHDTLRICPSLMQAHGVNPPSYAIDRTTPNTLELGTTQELLAYFQTLVLEVNLYAILAALAQKYQCPESYGWQIMADVLSESLERISFPADVGDEVRHLLLEAEEWPFKQVLAPLLKRKDFGTGMPSMMGWIHNPLRINVEA
ncbi:MAG TPA: IucA/IucC family protein [Oxalicibacterium sp.]|uniref:IucA/IucC family protein n=1 Tax=Oxalicibacterium sp. TaxID=2766525 RepID=UPI002CFA0B00|nr:IucA/IucC family protein [Oxalicibacterium sp.]HWU97127.1 IucA/IucC family protein [Oxalicibacterium sp.]